MQINLIYDSSVNAAPAGFKTAVTAAASFLDELIANPIAVSIQVGYGEDDNEAIPSDALSLGGANYQTLVNYSTLKTDLLANATSAQDQLAVESLPATDPTNGATFDVGDAEARALGLLPATSTIIDGNVGFGDTVSWNYSTDGQAVPGELDFVSDAELELIHALGMQVGTPSGTSTAFMLFRYSAPGVRELTVNSDGVTTPAAYFSIDGGQTNLGNYLTSGDSTLFNAGGAIDVNDTLAAPYPYGVEHVFSQTDALELNILGFDVNMRPTISGTIGGQTTTFETPINPFSGVTIGDANAGATDKLSITLSGPGSLGGAGLRGSNGSYTLTGTAAAITSELRALSFTPVKGVPNTSVTTTFTLSDTSSAYGTPAVNTTTSVIDTESAIAPTITGTVSGQRTTREAPVDPFSGVTIGDANAGATDKLSITLSGPGSLGGAGLRGSNGSYTLTGTAAAITSELRALSFTPVKGVPNTSVTTTFTLSDTSSAYGTPAVNTTTSVIDTESAIAPTITGTVSGQRTTREAPVDPFSGVTIGDLNAGATDKLSITLSGPGSLGGAGLRGSNGSYTLTGTAAAITSELRALSFTPVKGVPNTSVTTTFTLSDTSSAYGTPAVNTTTSVIDTESAIAPTITGTVSGQRTTREAPVDPFSGVTIGDANAGATDKLSITLSGPGSLGGAGLRGSNGSYTLTGTAAAITSELRALSFTPVKGVPNTSVTTTFTLSDTSSAYGTPAVKTPIVDRTTTVTDSDPALTGLSLLFQNVSGQAAIWEMNGTNLISSALLGAKPGPNWRDIGTSDFNADAHPDVLLQNTNGAVTIWETNGTAVTSSAAAANPGASWHAIGTGDFNADGHSDILLQNTNGNVAIWDMNGTTLESGAVVAHPGPNWKVVGTGDFSGDGHSDILLQNTNGNVAIWEMNGTDIMSSAAAANPGASWHAIGTGDFNGDSHSDILLQNTNGNVAIWEMNGTDLVSSAAVANPGPSWHAIGTGDFNGDGFSDILSQNASGQAAVWEMDGTHQIAGGSQLLGANPGASWHAIKA